MTAPLALNRLSRRAHTIVAGVLTLALAGAGATFAIGFAAASSRAGHGVERTIGADLRAVLDVSTALDDRATGVQPTAFAGREGIAAAAPAIGQDVEIGADRVTLAAVPRGAITELAIPDVPLPASAPAGLPLAKGTLTVAVRLDAGAATAAGPDASLDVVVWLAGDTTAARRTAALGLRPDDELTLEVPAAAGETLLAIDLVPHGFGHEVPATLQAHDAEGQLSLPGDPVPLAGSQAQRTLVGAQPDGPLAAVVTRAFADRTGARPGETLDVRMGLVARTVALRVAAIAPDLPGIGAGEGVLVDLAALQGRAVALGGSVPAANELWVAASDGEAAIASVRAALTSPARILTAEGIGTAAVDTAAVRLVLLGTIAVVLLAASCFAVVMLLAARGRAADALPLRSFGMTAALRRRTTAIEVLATAAFALAGGALGGWLTASALLPLLTGGGA